MAVLRDHKLSIQFIGMALPQNANLAGTFGAEQSGGFANEG
jgi:hypothetical protein